jgi:hypothetical protein
MESSQTQKEALARLLLFTVGKGSDLIMLLNEWLNKTHKHHSQLKEMLF